MVTDRWSRKIVALLHDPPDKPFAISGHEGRANKLIQIALGRAANADEANRAKRADQVASAADRVDFPEKDAQGEYLAAYWQKQQAVLIHPLAGRSLELDMMADVSVTDTHDAARRAMEQLTKDAADTRDRFLRLWRLLPDKLGQEFPRVGALFGMLPAETRQPDHPLHQHLSITAAIADALPHPALMVFSIGPVQEFIAAARRTQDLWMGSYLLSYLTWAAMKTLAEEFGPDVVIFPSLRGQPLCDWWLYEQGVPITKPGGDALALATLPNKFVALLPASEAKSAAEKAEQAVCDEWKQLTNTVLAALSNGIMPVDEITRQMWQEQVAHQLEIYWVVLPWAWAGEGESEGKKQAEAVKSLYEHLSFTGQPPTDWPFSKIYALFAKPKAEGGGQYHPNWGTTYSLLYALADRALNARKSLRGFEPTEERGEKCTVCGQRAALRKQDGSRAGVRALWSQVAANLKERGRHAEIKPDGRERLCAVCSVKRFVQREVLKDKLSITGGFPSTSEIAVASFKVAVLNKLSDDQHGERLTNALKDHIEMLQHLGFPRTVAKRAIPKHHRTWQRLSNVSPQAKVYADKFLDYDGEAFFVETFTPKRLKADYGLTMSESDALSARDSLGKLLKAADEAGIPRPSKYYAILHMDGDHAGRWLSGTHDGLACFGRVLHPKVKMELEKLPGWADLLKARRLISPAVHAAVSNALASFALNIVRWVVEQRYAGRVVYAGGDDVLALLPLDQALPAARELRALFSGQVKHQKALTEFAPSEGLPVDFGDQQLSGYLVNRETPSREILLTMGPTATASLGIAMAHHTQPLDAALQAVRYAERDAKELYDRNALCVYLLKRSGEEARVGARWFYGEADWDTVALVSDVCNRFKNGRLSMKAAHAVFEEARTLSYLPREAQQAELKRLLKRHAEGLSRGERDMQAEELSARLTIFAEKLNTHVSEVGKRGFEQMAEWLLLARFLARGGEE